MGLLHWISILLEIGVSLLGIKLILRKKAYGWGILITFGIYTFYDIAKYASFPISSDVLYFLFFIASVSIFWAVWQISKNKKG
jgi:hypothetical protein